MNKPTRPSDMMVPKVTIGPISGSSKVYSAPAEHGDVRVPFREIALTDPAEPSFRVYDASGPYTDTNAVIDVEKGLPRHREQWVQWRGGVETYQGRDVRPEDNGNVTGSHAARDFPNKPVPMRGINLGSDPHHLLASGQMGLTPGSALATGPANSRNTEHGVRPAGSDPDYVDNPPPNVGTSRTEKP